MKSGTPGRGATDVASGANRSDSSPRVDSYPCLPKLHGTPSPVKTRAGSQNGAAPKLPSDMQERSPKAALRDRHVAVPSSGLGGSLGEGDDAAADSGGAVEVTVGVRGVLLAVAWAVRPCPDDRVSLEDDDIVSLSLNVWPSPHF